MENDRQHEHDRDRRSFRDNGADCRDDRHYGQRGMQYDHDHAYREARYRYDGDDDYRFRQPESGWNNGGGQDFYGGRFFGAAPDSGDRDNQRNEYDRQDGGQDRKHPYEGACENRRQANGGDGAGHDNEGYIYGQDRSHEQHGVRHNEQRRGHDRSCRSGSLSANRGRYDHSKGHEWRNDHNSGRDHRDDRHDQE